MDTQKTVKITDQLRQAMPNLSEAQRAVAVFLLDHPAEAAYLTSHELAARIDTSPSTVVRLAQALGYSGFPALQSDMQEFLRQQLSATTRLYSTIISEDNGNTLAVHLKADVIALEQAMVDIPLETFEKVVNVLARARRIYLVGLGVSTAVISALAFRLRRLRLDIHTVTEGGSDLFEPLLAMEAEDVVIAVAFQRIRPEIAEAIKFARMRGATTVAFAENPLSDHALPADHVLLTRRGPANRLNSLVVPIAVANALGLAISRKRVDESALAYSWLDEFQQKLARSDTDEEDTPRSRSDDEF